MADSAYCKCQLCWLEFYSVYWMILEDSNRIWNCTLCRNISEVAWGMKLWTLAFLNMMAERVFLAKDGPRNYRPRTSQAFTLAFVAFYDYTIAEVKWYGCFQKLGTPQIINLNRVFHYKPSILGYHHFRKPPFVKNHGMIFSKSFLDLGYWRWNIGEKIFRTKQRCFFF